MDSQLNQLVNLPTYLDEEGRNEIIEKISGNKLLEEAYSQAIANKDNWVQSKFDQAINNLVGLKTEHTLGGMYKLRDFRVVKSCETNVSILGGTAQLEFRPIDTKERVKMAKKYKDIHLDYVEINCQSRMPQGSSGFATTTLYDERFVTPELGFISAVVFPLNKKITKASIKVNYPISTLDDENWVMIITVHDHNLKDNSRPCNFNIVCHYKYTNNLQRFSTDESSDKDTFKVIDKTKICQNTKHTIRNSLEYSISLLTNKNFLNKLSENELRCFKRCLSLSHSQTRSLDKIEKSRNSICISELDFRPNSSKSKNIIDLQQEINDKSEDENEDEFKTSP